MPPFPPLRNLLQKSCCKPWLPKPPSLASFVDFPVSNPTKLHIPVAKHDFQAHFSSSKEQTNSKTLNLLHSRSYCFASDTSSLSPSISSSSPSLSLPSTLQRFFSTSLFLAPSSKTPDQSLSEVFRAKNGASFKNLQNPQNFKKFSSQSGASNVAAIKQLRERTGAPMKDVKESLVSNDWDIEAAFVALRRKGMAAASKKKSRVAADGLLGVAQRERQLAVVVEVNSETDFVARNDIFQHLVHRVASAVLESEMDKSNSENGVHSLSLPQLEEITVTLDHSKLSGQRSIAEAIAEVSALTGENIKLRRAFLVSQKEGWVTTYLHGSPQPGLARIAGIVGLQIEGSVREEKNIRDFAENLAMHAVASRPLYLHRDQVPSSVISHERDILTTQAAGSGKPANVIEKMVDGRLRKYYEDVVMLEQKFVMDETKKVQAVLEDIAKKEDVKLKLNAILRLEVGEGVERVEKNFSEEVLAQASQAA